MDPDRVKKRRIVTEHILEASLLLTAVCVLSFYATRTIPDSSGIVVTNDEFGYWGIAATLAGKDWRPLLATAPYYAFGYSLLLVPLFWLGLPAATMYQLALVMNALMLLTSFFVALRCIRLLLPRLSPAVGILVAFAANAYSNTLIQSQIAWTETLLWLLYWLIFWAAIRLFQRPTVAKSIFLALLCGVSFCVHMRTLGIMIGAAISMVFAGLLKKIKLSHILAFFAPLAVIVFVVFVIAQPFFKDFVFSSSEFSDMNTFSSVSGKVSNALFSLEGLRLCLLSICGKLFYLGTSTLLAGFLAILYLFKQFFFAVTCLRKKTNYCAMPWLFLFFTAGCMFGVDCVAMYIPWGRLDCLVYGRYMENTFGPLIMLGLLLLLSGSVKWPQIVISGTSLYLMACITNRTLDKISEQGTTKFNTTLCVEGWGRFIRENNGSAHNLCFYIFSLSIAVLLAAWGLMQCRSLAAAGRKRWRFKGAVSFVCFTGVPTVLFACVWIWASIHNTDAVVLQKGRQEALESFFELTSFNDGQEPQDMLFVYKTTADLNPYSKYIQMAYPNLTVRIASTEEEWQDAVQPDTLVVTNTNPEIAEIVQTVVPCIAQNNYVTVYSLPDSPWTKAVCRETLLTNAVAFHVQLSGIEGPVMETIGEKVQTADGKSSILFNLNHQLTRESEVLFGPYIQLPAGDYQVKFTIKCDAENALPGMLATCSVTANSGVDVLSEETIDVTSFAGVSEIEVCLHFRCRQLTENVEFVTRLAQDANVEIVSIQLEGI